MLNPFKMIANTVCLVLTLGLLGFSHYQAFKLGAKSVDNPLFHAMNQIQAWTSGEEEISHCNEASSSSPREERSQEDAGNTASDRQQERVGAILSKIQHEFLAR
jgi:hypothetical protein